MHGKCSSAATAEAAQSEWPAEKENQGNEVALCSKHYRLVHRYQNEQTCFLCGRRSNRLHRPINARHLQNGAMTDVNQTALKEARLCERCYADEMHSDESQYTSDFALDKIVEQKTEEIHRFQQSSITTENCTQYAKAIVTAHLARTLHANEGILLQSLFEEYNGILEENGVAGLTKSAYLLSHVEQQLGHYLNVVFVKGARHPGYLLVRTGCDLHHALYCALTDKAAEKQTFSPHVQEFPKQPAESRCADLDEIVLSSLNECLHEQACAWTNKGKERDNLTSVDLDEQIKNTNPRLWRMISALTNPKRTNFTMDDGNPKSRRLPCLFILAAMAHEMHPPCHFPLHLALTDMIDGLSGSAELMLTMSRLGICSSRDTLQRLKTNVFNQRHESGLQCEVATGAFSITSIDNIDRAAPSTRITPTNQQRGFHGTSIQHVAPKPLSCKLTAEEVPVQPMASTARAGLFSAQVSSRKVKSNQRTVQEGQMPAVQSTQAASSCNALELLNEAGVDDTFLNQYRVNLYCAPQAGKRPLDEAAVRLSEVEQVALQDMQDKIIDYMLAKQGSGMESAGLDGLKDHLRHQKEHSTTEQSTIFTLGVLPDHAESPDSLKAILDSVHDLYGVGTLQTHHMVVGDQKLYSNMQRLKRQYGDELEWLLPYPGDWHVLKNFQPVLSKLYHHAGLRDLAAEAGYKGANISGLESCSDFKHTHIFYLEVFESIYLHAVRQYRCGKHAEVFTYKGFMKFMQDLVSSHQTPALWLNILKDLGTYVMFWLSFRGGGMGCSDGNL